MTTITFPRSINAPRGPVFPDPDATSFFAQSVVIAGSPVPAVSQQYLATTRGQVPQSRFVSGTSATDSTNCVSENRKYYPPISVPMKSLRLVYCGFFSALSTGENPGGETNIGNDRKVNAVLNWNGIIVPVTFNNAAQGTIPDGSAYYFSDPIYPPANIGNVWPVGQFFYVQDRQEVTPGGYICRFSAGTGISGERVVIGASGMASQLNVAGAWSGGNADQAFYGPVGVTGDPVGQPDVVIWSMGDSIQAGANDVTNSWQADGSAGGGLVMRAAYNVAGRTIPVINAAANGTTTAQYQGSMTKRLALMKALGCSHLIDNYGTNDALSGSAIWSLRQSIYSSARVNGIQYVVGLPMIIRGSSSDSYVSTTGQTVTSQYDSAGNKRVPMNNLLRASVGTDVDAVFDTDKMYRDPTNSDLWRINGVANYPTNDGTHPNQSLIISAAEALNGVMASWARTGQTPVTPTYDAAATAFFSRMSVAPSAALKKALSDLFAGANAAGIPIASTFDGVYFPLHNEADSSLNLAGTGFTLTKSGTTTFTPYRSFKGDGSTGVYDSGFNPATATSPKFVQDSANLGVISFTNIGEATDDVGNVNARIGTQNTASQMSVRMNAAASYIPAVTDSLGVYQLSRTGSAGYDIYKRRPSFGTRTATSVAPSSNTMNICRAGGAVAYSTKELAGAWWGRGLTSAEYASWHDLVNTFSMKLARLA